MTLWGARDGIIPLWASILVFSPFVLDATSTLLRRLFAGERIWEAHHGHYYQRLVRAGWGHRRTVLWEYAVMLGCSISGLWGMWQVAAIQWLLVAMWAVIYLALIRGVLRVEG